jgi:hypothetical protein
MAHYAFLDNNNRVVQVIIGRDEDDLPEGIDSWETYYGNLKGFTCKRTSYNTRNGVHYTQELDADGNLIPSDDQTKAFRHNYATIGGQYLPEQDAFIRPKPDSDLPIVYQLDTDILDWVAVPAPTDS